MIDTYTELKKELSTLNPKITDLELNNATFNLLSLCKLAAQIIEEIDDCDPQTVAQLLQRGNGGAVVAAADYIVYGGLRNAADRAQLVNSQVSFCT